MTRARSAVWLLAFSLLVGIAHGQGIKRAGGGSSSSVTPAGSSGDWQTNSGGTALGSIAANGVAVGLTASIATNTLTIACPSGHTCPIRIGGTTTSASSLSTTVTPGTGTYTAYVYYTSGGTLTYGHNGTSPTCGAGITCTGSITSFPTTTGTIPLYTATVTSNSFVGQPVSVKPYATAAKSITSSGCTVTETAGAYNVECASTYDPMDFTKLYRHWFFADWGTGFGTFDGMIISGTCGSTTTQTDNGLTALALQGNPCYVYWAGSGTTVSPFADIHSGASPKTSEVKFRGARTSTGAGTGNIYWGWSGATGNVNVFIGIRYTNGGQFQCVKRTGGADTEATNIVALDNSFHTFRVLVTAQNTLTCYVDTNTVTLSTGTAIPTSTNWWMLQGSDAANTSFASVKASVYVGGLPQ